ncbi:MAG: 50S ribosomal protein L9 [Minisyncoccia bacterium]
MKIILLKDVAKVGRKFDVKNVADGLALNKLIPRGDALQATPGNIKMIEDKNKNSLMEVAQIQNAYVKAIAGLKDGKLDILGKTNELGHLFAGIHKKEIIMEFKKVTGLEISEESLELEKPIKEVGIHELKIAVGNKRFELAVDIKGIK